MPFRGSDAEGRRWLKNLAAQGQVVEIEQPAPKPKKERKPREPKEPKPIDWRAGFLWGKVHLWAPEGRGWLIKCGSFTVNVAQPDWSGEGEECPRCREEEVQGENAI